MKPKYKIIGELVQKIHNERNIKVARSYKGYNFLSSFINAIYISGDIMSGNYIEYGIHKNGIFFVRSKNFNHEKEKFGNIEITKSADVSFEITNPTEEEVTTIVNRAIDVYVGTH